MTISPVARVVLIVISCVLLVPVFAADLQSTKELEAFHNRALARWPEASSFVRDPTQFFGDARRWLADRAYPIVDATVFHKRILLAVLDTPPQRRVTLAGGDFIFLNGPDEGAINALFQRACIEAHSPSVVQDLQAALSSFAAFSETLGIPLDVILVPTPNTLYGDRLPLSVPLRYRTACAARAAGQTPLLEVRARLPTHYVFPLREMRALRNREGFYPSANYHPRGLSLKVLRDTYLSQLGIAGTVDETVMLSTLPSELLLVYGLYRYVPVYQITNSNVAEDQATDAALKAAIADLFEARVAVTHSYVNARPVSEETLLMLSDSFGDFAAPVFAGGFRRLLHVNTNNMEHTEVRDLISRVRRLARIDRVAVFIQEGGSGRAIAYGQAFARAQPAEPLSPR